MSNLKTYVVVAGRTTVLVLVRHITKWHIEEGGVLEFTIRQILE